VFIYVNSLVRRERERERERGREGKKNMEEKRRKEKTPDWSMSFLAIM
jgi:hypothetical protein